MKAAIVIGTILLVLLIVFNPDIDQHRGAIGEFFDKRWNEDYHKQHDSMGWFTKALFWIAGDDLKSSMRSKILDHVYRENYGVFSLGYIEGHVATIGAMGFVYTCISE